MRRTRIFLGLVAASSAALGLLACLGEDVSQSTTPELPSRLDGATTPTPTPAPTGSLADAGPATPDAGGGFCDEQARPPGIAADDYFCTGFDGADHRAGMVATVPDGGVLERVTDVFVSKPAAVSTRGSASLAWTSAGPLAFDEIDATVRVNVGALSGAVPASQGSISVFQVVSTTSSSSVELRFGRSVSIEGASYSGYYVEWNQCPSGCISARKAVTATFPQNLWSTVRIRWSSVTGATLVSVDGASVFDQATLKVTSTNAGVRIGFDQVMTPIVPRYAYDDLRVSIKRR